MKFCTDSHKFGFVGRIVYTVGNCLEIFQFDFALGNQHCKHFYRCLFSFVFLVVFLRVLVARKFRVQRDCNCGIIVIIQHIDLFHTLFYLIKVGCQQFTINTVFFVVCTLYQFFFSGNLFAGSTFNKVLYQFVQIFAFLAQSFCLVFFTVVFIQ